VEHLDALAPSAHHVTVADVAIDQRAGALPVHDHGGTEQLLGARG
jgi:hypothetical protein